MSEMTSLLQCVSARAAWVLARLRMLWAGGWEEPNHLGFGLKPHVESVTPTLHPPAPPSSILTQSSLSLLLYSTVSIPGRRRPIYSTLSPLARRPRSPRDRHEIQRGRNSGVDLHRVQERATGKTELEVGEHSSNISPHTHTHTSTHTFLAHEAMAPMASRLRLAPHSLLQLLATILLAPSPLALASPQGPISKLAGFSFNELFARWDCSGEYCGYSSQLCCTAGSTCYTDAQDQAQCGSGVTSMASAAGGYWSTYYVTYTDTTVYTKMMSTYIATAVAATTSAGTCNYALNETPCGSICCASNQYCYEAGQCSAGVGAGSSGYYSTYQTPMATAGSTTAVVIVGSAPLRGTSSSLVLVTQTASPSTTIPFETPVATGANITLTNSGVNHQSGLSGGAIAGIVIGVLVGLLVLALIIFSCCLRGIWDAILACFGGGRRRRRRTEVEEYERRSHRSSRGGGRTWYGAARPARVSRYEERDRRGGGAGKELLGIGAGLAALWAVLGLKRKRERREKDEVSEYYSSDYYTSASELS